MSNIEVYQTSKTVAGSCSACTRPHIAVNVINLKQGPSQIRLCATCTKELLQGLNTPIYR